MLPWPIQRGVHLHALLLLYLANVTVLFVGLDALQMTADFGAVGGHRAVLASFLLDGVLSWEG